MAPPRQANGCPQLAPWVGTTWRRGVGCCAEESDRVCSEHTRRRHGFVWALLGVQEHNGNLAQTDPLGTAEPRSHNMKHKETDLYALGLGERLPRTNHICTCQVEKWGSWEQSMTQSELWHSFPRTQTACLPISPEKSLCVHSLMSVLPSSQDQAAALQSASTVTGKSFLQSPQQGNRGLLSPYGFLRAVTFYGYSGAAIEI